MDFLTVDRYGHEDVQNRGGVTLEQLHLQAKKRQELKDKNERLGQTEHVTTSKNKDVSDAVKPRKRKLDSDNNGIVKHAKVKHETKKKESLNGKVKKKISQLNKGVSKLKDSAEINVTGNQEEQKKKKSSNKIRKKSSGKMRKKKRMKDSKSLSQLDDPSKINENGSCTQPNMEEDAFPILGDFEDQPLQKVKKVVPEWMLEPVIISTSLKSKLIKVSEFPGLLPSLLSLLKSNGVKKLFPVQKEVISFMFESFCKEWMRPRDILVSAPTGSGKTLAYVLPIVQALHGRVVCNIKALVVLPVVDLALQVFNVFKTYCKGSGLQVGLAVGSKTFSEEQSMLVRKGYSQLHSLVDILVCTPGRLVDHVNRTRGFSLKGLRFLVVDEADRMMQHIKQNWLKFVLDSCNASGQRGPIPLVVSKLEDQEHLPMKLLFTATLTHNPEMLESLELFQPKLFTASTYSADVTTEADTIDKYVTPKKLKEFYVTCSLQLKPLILLHFIHTLKYRHLLCFTNSLESSHRLFLLLSTFGGAVVKEISSNFPAVIRQKVLREFSKGLVDVIVCSDVMARGIDIENVQYVISYDYTPYIKSYVHRVGRTARAGRVGTAISFLLPSQELSFRTMMKNANKTSFSEIKIHPSDLQPLEEQYKSALSQVRQVVHKGGTKVKQTAKNTS